MTEDAGFDLERPGHDPPGRRSLADRLHNERSAWLVLALSVSLTLAGWYVANTYVYQRAGVEFERAVVDTRERIAERLDHYRIALKAGVAFVDTLGRLPTRDEWHRFVQDLGIEEDFPGIQGYGLSLMLNPDQLAAHEASVRAEGYPDYAVYPRGERARYSAIIYLEPFDWRNQRAFGYDMYSNEVRRRAMDRAASTGEPAASGRVTLVQETAEDTQAGFLVYLPLYDRAGPSLTSGTSGTDRGRLIGFVYAPFRVNDLMRGTLGEATSGIAFSIFDGDDETSGSLLYATPVAWPPSYRPGFSTLQQFDVAGRAWQIRYSSTPTFDEKLSTAQPSIIATAAFGVDILLFLVLLSSAAQRRRIEAEAREAQCALEQSHQRFQRAQTVAGLASWELDEERGLLRSDATLRARYGFNPDEPVDDLQCWAERLHPDDRERTMALVSESVANHIVYHNRFRIVLPDGSERHMESTAFPATMESDGRVLLSGIERDITDEVLRNRQLALHASVFDNAREAIFITDADARILSVNRAFTEITGYRREQVIGRNPRILQSGDHDDAFYAAFWQALQARGYWEGEIHNRHQDGHIIIGHVSVASVFDEADSLSHYLALFTDISKQKTQEEELRRLASFDPLTALPNRALLNDRMQQAMGLARRNGRRLAICYLDLDGFKGVNDRFGHDAGDELLIQVAGRLRQLLREYDTASRLGGDEFLIMIADIEDAQNCTPLLQRLLDALAAPYLVRGHFTQLSASIGLTIYPDDAGDADTLIRHADQAMYRAKEAGRNRFELFDLSMAERSRDYQSHVAAVSSALTGDEFVFHYQPKVDMHSGAVIGAEALLRWQHPERGLLYPADFICYLDDALLFASFGRWVLRTAMTQLRQWLAEGLDLSLSVNISGLHLQEPDFVAELGQLLKQYSDVPPCYLELEVLETSALEDIDTVARVLAECKKLGVKISIDDFGTGYSSLVYLRGLGADIVKIDQTFVRGMLDSDEDHAIVEGIVRLAQVFGREVIAEGVETEAHGVALLKIGCHLAQGWGIAKAMPADALPGWIADYRVPASWPLTAEAPA